ncbi:molybdopterin-binding protein [Pedobacter gandavensis]|uniref:Molybdopterin-binding protein n=1 Tax=Pedobacter gandavensis TaxID=2679963 RepID=A0ABR6ES06_9SPHI|nr:molybdopterin-binding protein [Pedobacter gandavensis]MBB2148044.1 molybdopterin-binding protein [Pedobacter gandavensis]
MKYLVPFLLFFCLSANAQESKQFIVDGQVKKTLTISLDAIQQHKMISLDSLTIYNHLMQRKSSVKNIKAALLKDVLAGVEITAGHPKELSEYYLVCTATDNYKVVLSWNEVFNSKNDSVLILSSFDVDPTKKENGNIAMIVTTDQATGRRFVKGLSKISILRLN